MVQIIVILLTNYILIPLVELTLSERIKLYVEIAIYLTIFVWTCFALFTGKTGF